MFTVGLNILKLQNNCSAQIEAYLLYQWNITEKKQQPFSLTQ